MVLEEESKKGEKIPPNASTPPKPPTPKPTKPSKHSFFENDHTYAGKYTPPKPQPITGTRYQPIDRRKEVEPSYRLQYQAMRNLGAGNQQYPYVGAPSNGERFYKQGCYIAKINDDYQKDEPFSGWYYSFMDLSVRQFRRYVTLRKSFTAGEYTAITEHNLGYLFLFAAELISGTAHSDLPKDEVFAALEGIVAYVMSMPYEDEPQRLLKLGQLRSWVFAYAISHGLTEQALRYEGYSGVRMYGAKNFDAAVIAFREKDYDALLTALSVNCPYHICTSAICKKEPFDKVYPKLLQAVLTALDNHFHSGKTMEARLFGRPYQKDYSPFPETEARIMGISSFKMELNAAKTYAYDAKTGRYSVYAYLQINSDWIAAVLRCMDYYFRIEADTTKLKSSGMSSMAQEKVIAAAVHEFCEQHHLIGYEKRRKEKAKQQKKAQQKADADAPQTPQKVEIDFSKLADIRKDASEVESRLLSVYDQQEETPAWISEPKPEISAKPIVLPQQESPVRIPCDDKDEWVRFSKALSADQKQYMSMILQDTVQAKAFLQQLQTKSGILPELFIEGLNETALDHIGDTLIDGDGSDGIFEDYIDAARAVFSE